MCNDACKSLLTRNGYAPSCWLVTMSVRREWRGSRSAYILHTKWPVFLEQPTVAAQLTPLKLTVFLHFRLTLALHSAVTS